MWLDLINNKSRVLRFADCIQCEACMWACPTDALVMHPEGSLPPPLKVPDIDQNFQTRVPGQYLIGEVAGKPLVKSAANLGRGVIEHALANGLTPLRQPSGTHVDVAIVGAGPAGLSAALTCLQRGLSYVVLDKDHGLASTIARYPKGKFVMAEPYDTVNLSLLPVFDSSKEQLIGTWQTLIRSVGLRVNLSETVETIARRSDGQFDVKTSAAAYRAQRVVIASGTRGKPRTLGVAGESLPKVHTLLDDPDAFRGRAVLVVGGGDSAVEAAMALADAGAMVNISYRGKSRVSSGFGPRVDPLHGAGGYHTGLDLAAPTGTPVVAAAAGTVVRAGDAGGYGQLIVLRHADGSETRYAHLSAIGVEVGAQVARGQAIGAVGSTGRSTGPHLHFELRRDGHAVDPRPALPLPPPSTPAADGRTTSLEKPDAH
jgi:murein DD-endopeptidase MepM/ murein hydrolase activator NlpD